VTVGSGIPSELLAFTLPGTVGFVLATESLFKLSLLSELVFELPLEFPFVIKLAVSSCEVGFASASVNQIEVTVSEASTKALAGRQPHARSPLRKSNRFKRLGTSNANLLPERNLRNVFTATGPDTAVYYQMRVFLNRFQGTLEGYKFEDPGEANSSQSGNLPGAPTITVPDPMCAPLYVSNFVTSAFPSFAALVGSYSGRAKLVNAKRVSREKILDKLQTSSKRMALARWDWHRDQVDHRFEELEGGKQGFEAARLELREAYALHDENFRALADSLSDLYFLPLAERLEIYVLRKEGSKEIISLWLRSPESLDLRLAVFSRSNSAQQVGFVGRTEITAVKKLGRPQLLNSTRFQMRTVHR
jgi:hypothetical protein